MVSTNTERVAALHATDFFDWSQKQARLLKSLRLDGQSVPMDLDIEAIAEEIEDLGRAELNAVESYIRNIFVHLIKAVSDPDAPSVSHWRTETTTFHADLVQRYSRAMRQRVDLERSWRLATRIAGDSLDEHGATLARGLPGNCPFSIDHLVAESFDFEMSRRQLTTLLSEQHRE